MRLKLLIGTSTSQDNFSISNVTLDAFGGLLPPNPRRFFRHLPPQLYVLACSTGQRSGHRGKIEGRKNPVQLGWDMPKKTYHYLHPDRREVRIKKPRSGLELSRSGQRTVVRGLAYPWPVAPQQSRFPFQLMALRFLTGRGLAWPTSCVSNKGLSCSSCCSDSEMYTLASKWANFFASAVSRQAI